MPLTTTLSYTTKTIANAATTSDALDCSSGRTLVGLTLPAALTGTTMTFTCSNTLTGTYVPVYAAGGASAYSVTVGTSRYVPVDPNVFLGVKYVKLVSGSTETGARSIVCHYRVVG